MAKKLPEWLGEGSVDQLMDYLFPKDQSEAVEEEEIRKQLKSRAERLLFSPEMSSVWKTLSGKRSNLAKFFWVAMNAEVSIEPTPEPRNSDIKNQYSRIAALAEQLLAELHAFANANSISPYSDLAKILATRARANRDDVPDEFDLAYSNIAQEVQYPQHGFDNGRFEKALGILAQASRIASKGRQSSNRVTKANSTNRLRNEIALTMAKAAHDYLGSYYDEAVASTVNAILDLVEDGEAITGDSVKKLRAGAKGKILPDS